MKQHPHCAPWWVPRLGRMVIDANGRSVACVVSGDRDLVLIAAAPELADALEDICEAVGALELADAVERGRKVLDRARGRRSNA